MARLLVQLKLRLLLGALRSSGSAKASFIASTVFAVVVAIGVFAGLAALRGHSASADLATVVFTIFAFGWLVLPLLAFGLDSTLDPATLALYPLRTRQLAVGLLAASCTGAWPLANLIGLLGVTVGLASGAFGVVVAVVATALQVLFCIILARFVTTALAGLLRSRRGRDLAVLLVIPIFVLYEIFIQVVPKAAASGKLTASSFAGVDRWMRWIPPGLAVHAIQDASTGQPGTALLLLALLAAVIGVLGWLWIRSLGRALVTVDTSTRASAVRGNALPFARFGLRGTLTARFWIYQRRDPVALIYWAITLVVAAVVSFRSITTPRYLTGLIAAVAVGAGLMAALHANSIGMSGQDFSFESQALSGRRGLRAYFSGQDIALGVIAVPLLTVISFVLAAVAGHPVDGFLGLSVALAAIGAGLAVSNAFTVALPYPVEKRPGLPVPNPANGYMGQRLVGTLGSLVGTGVLAVPVVLAVAFTHSDPAVVRMPVLVVCAAAYGLALAWAGVRIAAGLAEPRIPELGQIGARSRL
jgi:ABC-2 type transport system permease protein